MIDGKAVEVVADNKNNAMDLAQVKLNYDDFDEFYFDINYIEWEDDTDHVIEDLINKSVKRWNPNDNYYLLSRFIKNINPIPEPTIELKEEFDEIF